MALAKNNKTISGKIDLRRMPRETRDLRQFPMPLEHAAPQWEQTPRVRSVNGPGSSGRRRHEPPGEGGSPEGPNGTNAAGGKKLSGGGLAPKRFSVATCPSRYQKQLLFTQQSRPYDEGE